MAKDDAQEQQLLQSSGSSNDGDAACPYDLKPSSLSSMNGVSVRERVGRIWAEKAGSRPAKGLPQHAAHDPGPMPTIPQDKDDQALNKVGGVQGLARALRSDLHQGLSNHGEELGSVAAHRRGEKPS
jgi:hypothetical protein